MITNASIGNSTMYSPKSRYTASLLYNPYSPITIFEAQDRIGFYSKYARLIRTNEVLLHLYLKFKYTLIV